MTMERFIMTRRSDGAPCGVELVDKTLARSTIWQEVFADQTRIRITNPTPPQKEPRQ
jgi:hypothetical protein